VLAFLDALCAALLARHSIEIYRLLALPQGKKLPRVVREEAIAIAKAGPACHRAPVQTLHLFYKLSHVVDETTLVHDEAPRRVSMDQMEFRFRARKAG
jgi:hypothetical protein